jgi:hypothetical protein
MKERKKKKKNLEAFGDFLLFEVLNTGMHRGRGDLGPPAEAIPPTSSPRGLELLFPSSCENMDSRKGKGRPFCYCLEESENELQPQPEMKNLALRRWAIFSPVIISTLEVNIRRCSKIQKLC